MFNIFGFQIISKPRNRGKQVTRVGALALHMKTKNVLHSTLLMYAIDFFHLGQKKFALCACFIDSFSSLNVIFEL